MFHEITKGISTAFQGLFKEVSRGVQEDVKDVSMVLPECFKGVYRK